MSRRMPLNARARARALPAFRHIPLNYFAITIMYHYSRRVSPTNYCGIRDLVARQCGMIAIKAGLLVAMINDGICRLCPPRTRRANVSLSELIYDDIFQISSSKSPTYLAMRAGMKYLADVGPLLITRYNVGTKGEEEEETEEARGVGGFYAQDVEVR